MALLRCSMLAYAGPRWSHLKAVAARPAQGFFIWVHVSCADEVIEGLKLERTKSAATPTATHAAEGTGKLQGPYFNMLIADEAILMCEVIAVSAWS